MSLSLNQKRFLIYWILFHSFALFVNLAYIRGEIDNGSSTVYLFLSGENSGFWPFTSYYSTDLKTVEAPTLQDILPTKTDSITRPKLSLEQAVKLANEGKLNEDSLLSAVPSTNTKSDDSPIIQEVIGVSHSYYGGLFNSYGFAEYIFYIVLGLVIIFVPKLISSNPETLNQTINLMEPIKYYYSDENEFRKVFKTISEKVQLLAVEFDNPEITQYWTTAFIEKGAIFLVSKECTNASIVYRITKIIKESLS